VLNLAFKTFGEFNAKGRKTKNELRIADCGLRIVPTHRDEKAQRKTAEPQPKN
jgi:hypothetical protein